MEQTIVRKLREIEKNERIHILLAVESGSRAFIFARKKTICGWKKREM